MFWQATALEFAEKAVEASKEQDPGIMDTLALAQQMTGDIDAAVKTEKAALALLPPGPSGLRAALEPSLVKYLIEQGSYAEAETLLLAMYKQLSDNPKSSAKQEQESIQRIIDFYDAWHAAEPGNGYDAKTAEWRAKLPAAGMDEAEPTTQSGDK